MSFSLSFVNRLQQRHAFQVVVLYTLLFVVNGTTTLTAVDAAVGVVDGNVAESTTTTTTTIPSFQVPAFPIQDLIRGTVDRTSLAIALQSNGIVAVTMEHNDHNNNNNNHDDDDDYEATRYQALMGLCHCAIDNGEQFVDVDGTDTLHLIPSSDHDPITIRQSYATATVGNVPLPISEELYDVCGHDSVHALDRVRDYVAMAATAFTTALDDYLDTTRTTSTKIPLLRTIQGGAYHTVSSVVRAARNLEHFHIYTKMKSQKNQPHRSQEVDDFAHPTLAWHTDAGLYLAFVPAIDCQSYSQPFDDGGQGTYSSIKNDASLIIRDSTTGQPAVAIFPPNSVIMMLGAGAEHWLHVPDDSSSSLYGFTTRRRVLRATHHAVQMQPGTSRAWYGMMHLVPENALIEPKHLAGHGHPKTLEDLRSKAALAARRLAVHESNDWITVGCGNVHHDDDDDMEDLARGQHMAWQSTEPLPPRRRLQHVPNGSACNNSTQFYCWMSCLDIPEAANAPNFVNEDYSLYCVDPSVLAATGNKVSAAVEACTEDGIMGRAMNTACMGSWQPTAPGVPSQSVIVNATSKTSSTPQPFCYSGTSMFMDGFHWRDTTCVIYLFPVWILDTRVKFAFSCLGTILFGMALEWVIRTRRLVIESTAAGWKRLVVSGATYGLQLTMGYTLMLIVMIYSIPLFLCVVIGLVSGHVFFSAQDAIFRPSSSSREDNPAMMGWNKRTTTATTMIASATGSTMPPASVETTSDDCNVPSPPTPMEAAAAPPDTELSCCHTSNYYPPQESSYLFNNQQHHPTTTTSTKNLVIPEGSTPCCQHTL